MVRQAKKYMWSSYNQYISAYQDQNIYIDAGVIKECFKRQEEFEEYMNAQNNDECLEYNPVKKYTDTTLKNILHKEIDVSKLKEMTVEERNKIIKDIYQKTKVSIRQLGRVLGMGKTIIEKAVKEDE